MNAQLKLIPGGLYSALKQKGSGGSDDDVVALLLAVARLGQRDPELALCFPALLELAIAESPKLKLRIAAAERANEEVIFQILMDRTRAGWSAPSDDSPT